jgi:hypothetical protein
MTISIDRENITHIEVYYRGLGPKTLYYSDHKDILDSLFDMFSGDYKYYGSWRMPETAGTGVNTFIFYSNREEICKISVLDFRVLTSTMWKRTFYTYTHRGNTLDLTDFYAYLNGL